ncbi:hypothetical protein ACLOJK_038133 [Asimina triloba]
MDRSVGWILYYRIAGDTWRNGGRLFLDKFSALVDASCTSDGCGRHEIVAVEMTDVCKIFIWIERAKVKLKQQLYSAWAAY